MNELGKTGLKVSPIGLGTVEIGLAYGIGVKDLPSEKEAETILKSAIDLGITYIDTARGYGVAEERIGKSGIGKIDGIVIGTKCAQFLEKGEDPHGVALEHRIQDDVETSLRALQVDSLQLVQLHGGSKEQIERGEIIDIMQRLKDEGKIQHVGIATRGEEAPLAAIESGFFETIQTAYSILDQRMASQVLPKAKENNVGIINRSVLLKGALTPAYAKLPDALTPLKETAQKAMQVASHEGTTLPQLAMQFVQSNPAVSTALIGTINPDHLKTAIDAAATPLSQDVVAQLQRLGLEDPNQVDPSLWPAIN